MKFEESNRTLFFLPDLIRGFNPSWNYDSRNVALQASFTLCITEGHKNNPNVELLSLPQTILV